MKSYKHLPWTILIAMTLVGMGVILSRRISDVDAPPVPREMVAANNAFAWDLDSHIVRLYS